MANPTFKDISKGAWTPHAGTQPTREDIQLGAVLRIADATEAMAKNYVALQNECDMMRRWFDEERKWRQRLERSNAALRGQITKLKKAISRRQE